MNFVPAADLRCEESLLYAHSEKGVLDRVGSILPTLSRDVYGYPCVGALGFVLTRGVCGGLVVSRLVGSCRTYVVGEGGIYWWNAPYQYLWVAIGYDSLTSCYRPRILTKASVTDLLQSLIYEA